LSQKTIHIVSFDVPYPADYGGVLDVFTRLKWFSENGWDVHLHCFEYHRPQQGELEKWATVYYYPRPRQFHNLFSSWPFIVKTRMNRTLASRLQKTKDLVILEGLHTAWYTQVQPGKFWVRTHNIEHEYYEQLARHTSGLKKFYYLWEARKLKRFEKILKKAKGILAITPTDQFHFSSIHRNTLWLPPLFSRGTNFVQTEPYILYHGNLSVEENIHAANWILDNIVTQVRDYTFVFAGKKPSAELIAKTASLSVKLIANPSEKEMDDLIEKAQLHLLVTQQSTGLKLKCLHALTGSGHVVCNTEMVAGSGLEHWVNVCPNSLVIIATIHSLFEQKLSQEEWEIRQSELDRVYGSVVLNEISHLL
jgi:glycosyltransferase involved in cell wall biosynthesis